MRLPPGGWSRVGAWRMALAGGLLLVGSRAGSLQDAAPEVRGVRLGESPANVLARLARPDSARHSLGLRFWVYEQLGITLIWREGVTGLSGIVVRKPDAGAVRGVMVGASEDALRKEWGRPARLRQGGRFADFVGNGWVISVETRDGAVVEMTLLVAAPDP